MGDPTFPVYFSEADLWRLKDQIEAASDPDQRTPQDEAIIAKINRAWLRASAGRAALREREGKI